MHGEWARSFIAPTWEELFTSFRILATRAWRVYWRLSSGERLKSPAVRRRMISRKTLSCSSHPETALHEHGLFQPMQFYPSTDASAPTRPAPIVLLHGMGMSSEIFSLVTVDVNLVEHLSSHGFDV